MTKLVENSATTFTTIAPPTITSIGVYKAVMNISNPSVLSNAGKYRLYPIYIPKDSTAWSIMRGSNILNNCMVVTVASNNGSATILPELVAPELVLTGDIQPRSRLYQNNTLHVDLTLKNNGPDFFSKVGLCLINATDPNNRRYICESTVLCSAGETKTFHLKGTVTSPPGNYYLQAQFDSTNSNSTMNYKILKPSNLNNKLTQVLPPSGPPVLQLNNLISMTKGLTVSKTDSINLIASISNTGGYFDSRIIAFVFPKSGGYSLTYLTPIYVYIDSLQTQEMTLTGIPNLDLGEYSVSLYAFQDNNWNLLSPSYMASIDFTVSNGSSSIQKTTESFSILQIGGQLIIKSSAEIQQSKLFDLSGKLLRTGSAEKVIPLEDLAPGVYWLEIQSNGKTIHERFLKQ
ncbi:MAG: T9SS type A sorting domain-containing protein [Bacteroidia bacterium]|nr:T9SS type A sorting domain-containing protein [Bacteroidia bacterium]